MQVTSPLMANRDFINKTPSMGSVSRHLAEHAPSTTPPAGTSHSDMKQYYDSLKAKKDILNKKIASRSNSQQFLAGTV